MENGQRLLTSWRMDMGKWGQVTLTLNLKGLSGEEKVSFSDS